MVKSIGLKILGVVILLAFIGAAGNLMNGLTIRSMSDNNTAISEVYLTNTKNLADVSQSFSDIHNNLILYSLLSDEAEKAETEHIISVLKGSIVSTLSKCVENTSSEREKETAEALTNVYNDYISAYDQIFKEIKNGTVMTSEQILEKVGDKKAMVEKYITAVDILNIVGIVNMQEQFDEAKEISTKSMWIIMVSLLAALVVCVFITLFTVILPAKRASRKLKIIVDSIENNEGDLTQRIKVETKDEIGRLVIGINKFLDVLQSVMKDIKLNSVDLIDSVNEITEQIGTADNQIVSISSEMDKISMGMKQLENNSSVIRDNADDVSESMNNITNKTKWGMDFASDIKNRAAELREEGIKSKETTVGMVNQISDVMRDAVEKSNDVEKIITLTDNIMEIANQTHILSLNAAIEAARAGSQSGGFAVVAEEIRRLADSSRNIAGDIQKMNYEVTESVHNLADNAEKMLKFIDTNILPDYDRLVNTSEQYNQDAVDIEKMMVDLTVTSNSLNKNLISMVDSIKNISDTITESSDGINNVAYSTSNLTDGISSIKNEVEQNGNVSDQLNIEVEKFKNI